MGGQCCCEDQGMDRDVFLPLGQRTILDSRGNIMGGLGEPPMLDLVFELPDGLQRELSLSERPLGIKFTRTGALMVKSVHMGSHAESVGVQSGWQVVRINGVNTMGQDPEMVRELMKQKTAALPLV
mmetsp:Transcript_31012/g.82423  ORF Transcript_31012/g.82423 Transcript_31012/m.82423 type:complete len:126 (-) Transcript_31012:197-574(-)